MTNQPTAPETAALRVLIATGDRELFLAVREGKEHENLVAELVAFVGGNEQSAMLDERHERGIEHRLVLDGQGQNAVTRTKVCRQAHAVFIPNNSSMDSSLARASLPTAPEALREARHD